jgi:hypothetical protein
MHNFKIVVMFSGIPGIHTYQSSEKWKGAWGAFGITHIWQTRKVRIDSFSSWEPKSTAQISDIISFASLKMQSISCS